MAQHICTNENGIIELKRKPGRPPKAKLLAETLPKSTLYVGGCRASEIRR